MKKGVFPMKKDQDELQKDMLETACRLLSGDGLMVVCALYRKSMTLPQLCRWTKDCPEERMCQTLGQLEKSGIICRDAEEEGTGEFGENVRWRLTELGGELEEVFTGLERFGRLYERLLQLGIDVREENEGRWVAAESPEQKGRAEEKETEAKALRIKETKGECERRHGWEESNGQFLFRNPHQGYEDWYFYGRISGETAAVYLVTGEEYEKMREYMLLGKNAADAGSSLYLKIEMKAADIAPQQEAFYVRAEDMVIQESVREF